MVTPHLMLFLRRYNGISGADMEIHNISKYLATLVLRCAVQSMLWGVVWGANIFIAHIDEYFALIICQPESFSLKLLHSRTTLLSDDFRWT